jgi:hypothetical protein
LNISTASITTTPVYALKRGEEEFRKGALSLEYGVPIEL